MTIREFKEKYNPVSGKWGDTHQVTWDLFDEVEEIFDDMELSFETKVGSCSYKVGILMDVCNPDLQDYDYCWKMLVDLEKLTE